MNTSMQRPSGKLEYLFSRLYSQPTTEPFNLPLFKEFLAPVDAAKFNAFFAAFKASGWHMDTALAPYKDEELHAVVAFYDAVNDVYKFCPTQLFWRLNGIHVNMIPVDDE